MLLIRLIVRSIAIVLTLTKLGKTQTTEQFVEGTIHRNMTTGATAYRNVTARNFKECIHLCKLEQACRHVNLNENNDVCGFINEVLGRENLPISSPLLTPHPENIFVEMGLTGVARDCDDVGANSQGVYKIRPVGATASFYALCDNGWTVIQKRYDGSVDFNSQLWQDYKTGFGNLHGEFWLGLENMHLLTNQATYTIEIELDLIDGTHVVQNTYSGFRVNDEANLYKMFVSDSSPDAAYHLAAQNGMSFTTSDRDNDNDFLFNCALLRPAGWWYKSCARISLNLPIPTSATECSGWIDMANCMHMDVNDFQIVSIVSSVMKIRRE